MWLVLRAAGVWEKQYGSDEGLRETRGGKDQPDQDSEGFPKRLACSLGLHGERGNVKRIG